MNIIESIILGLIQGIAEFLPISSSGHLYLMERFGGLIAIPGLYTVMLHVATLFAVIIFFRKKIWKLLCILYRWVTRSPQVETDDEEDILCGTDERGRKTIIAVILTTLVTGALGLMVEKWLDVAKLPVGVDTIVVALGFIVTAILLIVSSIFEKRVTYASSLHLVASKPGLFATAEGIKGEGIVWYKALFIGFMQGVGTITGVSRSGATIAGSLFCGVDREVAGVYSFIASIPAILGALVLELKDVGNLLDQVDPICILIGMATAFCIGFVSLMFLMRVIKKGRLEYFAFYLVPMAIFSFSYFQFYKH